MKMTLDEFCKLNPQLPRPPFIKCELLQQVETMDLSLLNEKIHKSRFLLSRCSLTWVLSKYREILDGIYRDFGNYTQPSGSAHTKNEKKYTKEELNSLLTDIEDLAF